MFPTPCNDATLEVAQVAIHPLIIGADGIAGTSDDLTNDNIDMVGSSSVAHGNLSTGIVLPGDAMVLMTAVFSGISKPILAEYCSPNGRVILDTITKEFRAHQPTVPFNGPTFFMTNLLNYALSSQAKCVVSIEIDIKPGSDPNSVNPESEGNVPVAILSSGEFDAPSVVDRTSLTFGRTGNEESLMLRSIDEVPNCAPEDVDQDGDLDLICHFETDLTGLRPGDSEGFLKAMTLDGTALEGSDSISVVPPS